MFNPKDFLIETISRIVSSTPAYFMTIKWIATIAVMAPWVSEWILKFLEIPEPGWMVLLNHAFVKVGGIVSIFIAHLAKKDPNELPKS